MNSTGGKHWHLKLNVDRRSNPRLGTNSWHEIHFGVNMALRLPREALDTPDNGLLLWFVLGSPKLNLDFGLCGILGYGNLDNDMRGEKLVGKVGDHLEVDGNAEGSR